MHAAEGCLSQTLPLAYRVPIPSFATRVARSGRDRGSSRALLSRLLLDADGAAVRRRIDEPHLGWRDRPVCAGGEDHAMGRLDKPDRRDTSRRLGRDQPDPHSLNRGLLRPEIRSIRACASESTGMMMLYPAQIED